MSTALATYESTTREPLWTPTKTEMGILRNTICPKASTEQLTYFLNVAAYTGLNPIKKQICMLISRKKDKDSGKYIEIVHAYTTLIGMQVIAHRSGRLEGFSEILYSDGKLGPDGKIMFHECLPPGNRHPYAAKVSVFVKGCRIPFTRTLLWSEFGADAAKNEWSTWAKMSCHMLGKTVLVHALRDAFPDDLGDLSSDDELSARPEYAMDIRDSGIQTGGVQREIEEPAPAPKRTPAGTLKAVTTEPPVPSAEPVSAEPPKKTRAKAEKVEEKPKPREDIAALKALIMRNERDGGDVSWKSARQTLSSVPGVDISSKDPYKEIDFTTWTPRDIQEAISMYHDIEEEEKRARAAVTSSEEDWQESLEGMEL